MNKKRKQGARAAADLDEVAGALFSLVFLCPSIFAHQCVSLQFYDDTDAFIDDSCVVRRVFMSYDHVLTM